MNGFCATEKPLGTTSNVPCSLEDRIVRYDKAHPTQEHAVDRLTGSGRFGRERPSPLRARGHLADVYAALRGRVAKLGRLRGEPKPLLRDWDRPNSLAETSAFLASLSSGRRRAA